MDLDLQSRTGLPENLTALLLEFPRPDWRGHANFGELVRFWMQRHDMFRELLQRMMEETQAALERTKDPDHYGRRLAHLGGFFLNELHMHHAIEDQHYFPQLMHLDPRITQGFELLDNDHHALDAELAGFASDANLVLQAEAQARRDAIARVQTRLGRFGVFLPRHLEDEEDLIVPVILKSGFAG